MRLRELAGSRVRYGYRRLTVLLKREGWAVNAKRIYRLYTEEGLIVRTKQAQTTGTATARAAGSGSRGQSESGAWISLPSAWQTAAGSGC